MAGATGDGDEEWMQLNDTRWRGLGPADPIKNIEVSPGDVPCRNPLNPSRISGCYCPPFSK